MNDRVIPLLDDLLSRRRDDIEAWCEAEFAALPPIIYSSVDLRHSGAKLAPVDTNLFPAGFNNLTPRALERAAEQFRIFLSGRKQPVRRVLLLPENHTRNLYYLDNVATLAALLEKSGVEVRLGTFDAEAREPVTLESADGRALKIFPLERHEQEIRTACGYAPDAIIVNNDLTGGSPAVLHNIRQPVFPPVGMGWYRRRKSAHFQAYEEVARRFAADFGFDPWRIGALFRHCGVINFRERKGLECIALNAEKVLRNIREKYAEYGIKDTPHVFVKADSGTYGMGILTLRAGEEIFEINKKARQKMNTIKEGAQNSEVLIQEGVPTIDRYEGAVAEPMLYLVNTRAVGGAWRVHESRSAEESLNSPGMRFRPLCDERDLPPCDFRAYGLIARLATLAAAGEHHDLAGEESLTSAAL